MKSVRNWCIAGLVMGTVAVGCGPSNPPEDTGADAGTDVATDRSMPEGGSDVVMGGDTPAPRDVVTSDVLQMSDPCAASAVVDLTTMTPGADGNVRYMGNNNAAGLMGGLPAPDMCVGGGAPGHQVALRYRMRAAGALRVSTANPGTAMNFDTVVFVSSACSATGMALACNDDVGMGMYQSTAQTAGMLAMGTEVFIIVAGFSPPFSEEVTNQGTFELTVRELAPIAVGGACAAGDICAMGSTCLPMIADPMMQTCQQDGTEGALCRMAEPRCETGLTCSAAMATDPGVCRRVVATGACDVTGRTNVCMAPQVCGNTSATVGACRAALPEVEPNSTPMTAQMVPVPMGSVSIQAALTAPATDAMDCVAVAVPAMGSIYARTSDGMGGCPADADTLLRLFGPGGTTMLVESDDEGPGLCSEINGTTTGMAHALAAGTYVLCAVQYAPSGGMAAPIPSYVLDVAVLP